MIRKIARFSRTALAAMALIGVAILTLLALFGEKALRTEVEKRLGQALNRPVRVGAVSVNLAARTVELRDVVIPGLSDSKRPSLVAPRVRLALSFRSLFTSRILLRGFELDQPQISVQVFPDGSTDLPQLAPTHGSPSREVSLGKLMVSRGDLFLNDEQIPLEISWPNFAAVLATDGQAVFKGDLSAGPGPMRFGALPAQDVRFEVGVFFADSVLRVERGQLAAPNTELSLAGELDLHGEPKGELRLAGPFDLEGFDLKIADTGLNLKGIAQTKAVLSVNGSKFALAGTLKGEHGSYDSIPVGGFSTSLWWDGSNLRLKNLTLDALGGTAALDIEAPEKGAVRVQGSVEGLMVEPLLHWLFDYGTAGLGARVSGPIVLSLPRRAANRFTGTGDLQLTADPDLGDPVSGRFQFRAVDGAVELTGARFESAKSNVEIDGAIQPDRRLSLDVKLVSQDLRATDALGVRLRGAFGTAGAQPLGATGLGTFQGHVAGTMAAPTFAGRFSGTEVAYLGVSWGSVDWAGSASAVDLRSDRLIATRGAARVELKGSQRLGATGVDDAMDLNIDIRDWRALDLLHIVDSELDVEAVVSGNVRLLGTRSKPLGQASLTSPSGKASGFGFSKAQLALQFHGETVEVESLRAFMGGGELLAQGTLSDESGASAFAGELELKEVELSELGLQDGAAPMIGGHISGRAIVSGPTAKPRVKAHFESKRIFYGDEGVGAVAVDINGAGDGVLSVIGQSDSPRFKAHLSGTVEAKPPYVSRLQVKLASARVDPVLRALGSRFENAVVITASANATITGPLGEPTALIAQVRDGRLRVAVPEYAIEAAPGSVIDVEQGELRIAGLTLTGEGTSLNVSGKLALRQDDTNDLAITGRADMRVFSGFLREWRFRGAATLRSQIGGTPKAIRVSGGLDIENGAVRIRTFPQGLDGLNGRIVFNESQAKVAGLEGRFGGGRVTVSGQMGFGGAFPASFDFLLNGDSLGLRYPEGLRSTFGASLRMQGTMESHWLTGDLRVSKALWTRKYLITSELLGSSGATTGFVRAGGLKPSPMHLDIAIKAPGTLRLDNNLASLVAKADLTLTGSPTEPQVLGRVELERGQVFFRGNTYEVRKGVANFSNPREINPVFDIEADTRVRNYRLTLQASGTLDRVSTRITSDPPLTSAQIASLLTGGNENDIANSGSSSTANINELAVGAGGSTLVSSWLDDNVTGRFAQGFGLSRLSIDPGIFGRTGSRLTVGKRVGRDLEVVYSGLISGGRDRLVTVEYSLSNRFSLVGSWQEPNGLGLDARARFVLGRR